MNLMFRDLMLCLLLKFAEQSDVTGSHEPVHVTVGHDVILPCHLEPPYDVTTLTVEWRRNKVIVHVYRNKRDNLDDQDENFRGRTSLFHDELIRGNISLKLINVTEQDEGNYTCFVPKLDSQVRRGFIQLIVDPEENRNKGNQTDSDSVKKPEEINYNNRHHGFIFSVIIAAILVMVVLIIQTKRVKNNAGADGRGGHEQVETDDSRDEGRDPGAGRDGRGQEEPVEMSEMVNSSDEGQVKDETGEDDTDISLTQQQSTLRDSKSSSPHT